MPVKSVTCNRTPVGRSTYLGLELDITTETIGNIFDCAGIPEFQYHLPILPRLPSADKDKDTDREMRSIHLAEENTSRIPDAATGSEVMHQKERAKTAHMLGIVM